MEGGKMITKELRGNLFFILDHANGIRNGITDLMKTELLEDITEEIFYRRVTAELRLIKEACAYIKPMADLLLDEAFEKGPGKMVDETLMNTNE